MKFMKILVLTLGVGLTGLFTPTVASAADKPGAEKTKEPVVEGTIVFETPPAMPPRESRVSGKFAEPCTEGRCRCPSYSVRQTIMTPGQQPLGDRRFCSPPRGYNAFAVKDICMICPDNMTYSAMLRDRTAVLRRMNLQTDVCVTFQKSCL